MTQDSVIDGSFDIGALDVSVAATFNVAVIVDGNGDPKSGFIIVSKNSPQFQQAAHKIRVEGLVRASKRKSTLDTSSNEGAETMANAINANDLLLAVSVVTGWFGFADKGQPAEFSASTAKQMLLKFPTWRQKVLDELDKDENFIKG